MAGQVFESFEAAAAAIESKFSEILDNYVAAAVKELLVEQVQNDVYGAYAPKPNGWISDDHKTRITYQRRNSLLAVSAYDNTVSGNMMEVFSTAEPSPSVWGGATTGANGGFLQLLGEGSCGCWAGGFNRPAVPHAQARVLGDGRVINAIETALQAYFG